MISVQAFECGPVATMVYLVCNPALGEAFCIDAPPDSSALVLAAAETAGCRITHLLLTHTHWDHTADAAELVRQTGAQVYVHAHDAYRLIDPMRHTIWPLPFTIEPVIPNRYVEHGERFTVAGVELEVIHTPGHTEGGVCFVDHAHRRVFVGDTLFYGSVGRTDLPGGDMQILTTSIKERLFTLPETYSAYPGHGPVTTIGEERRANPFVGIT
ncbi:MAG: MBL fold metallo-hydrolase [Ignavibacteriae bacterium]|nr:MAG: MBL fold metallo-hydrolase [Ignavibacteriota bacterium]